VSGVWAAFGWLTVFRVPGSASARGVLPWAPLVGLVLGDLASLTGWLGARHASPLVGAVLAVALLAWLTRGLHLDGLADTADGLGPLSASGTSGRERALAVMRAGDVGPFGVATLVLTLLLQVACLAQLLALDGGWLALWTAVVAARLSMARCGLPGVPVAAGSSLGAAVAGTVSRVWWTGCAVAAVACVLATAWWLGDLGQGARLVGAAVLGLAAGELLHRRARARLGGVNGDVMGAAGEVTTTAVLLAAAVLLPLS